MIPSDVIIVGGGPAGSTCAWKLRQNGVDCIILDKHVFPRTKLCAGWITPQVVRSLELDPTRYPHSLTSLGNLDFHIYGRKFKFKTRQYSIRRYEFDDWLVRRSGVPVYNHDVCEITRDGEHYIIDGLYRCRYLVGAGGTYCPVYRTFFKEVSPRVKESLVTTMEEEFAYDHRDRNCHLWFFENKLPGYSWYVPKGKGHVNIGIGGKTSKLKRRGDTIKDHWDSFVNKLRECSLVDDRSFNPKGYHYYLRQNRVIGQLDHCYLIGDSVGLATRDWCEGIGPAVESGILAADSIAHGTIYSLKSIPAYSLPRMLLSRF